jgi:hypothetical protein
MTQSGHAAGILELALRERPPAEPWPWRLSCTKAGDVSAFRARNVEFVFIKTPKLLRCMMDPDRKKL